MEGFLFGFPKSPSHVGFDEELLALSLGFCIELETNVFESEGFGLYFEAGDADNEMPHLIVGV